jgi:hypothetical protein
MKNVIATSLVLGLFAVQSLALAQAPAANAAAAKPASCEEKAIDKNGKKLAGAAKASFLKKCEADAAAAAPASCEDKAVDKNGKKLAGAAKAASIKKCEADSSKK